MLRSDIPVITIDGPSGSGKSTVAQRLAKSLGWHYLDSGALYRVLGYFAKEKGISFDDAAELAALAKTEEVSFEVQAHQPAKVIVKGLDVTEHVRSEACGEIASKVSRFQAVREALIDLQHRFRKAPGLVTDGRDMGTVVFPDALVRFFLTATPEERAKRRFAQLQEMGLDVKLAALVKDLRERDRRDTERAVSPLKPSEGAVMLDTSAIDIEAVFTKILATVKQKLSI